MPDLMNGVFWTFMGGLTGFIMLGLYVAHRWHDRRVRPSCSVKGSFRLAQLGSFRTTEIASVNLAVEVINQGDIPLYVKAISLEGPTFRFDFYKSDKESLCIESHDRWTKDQTFGVPSGYPSFWTDDRYRDWENEKSIYRNMLRKMCESPSFFVLDLADNRALRYPAEKVCGKNFKEYWSLLLEDVLKFYDDKLPAKQSR